MVIVSLKQYNMYDWKETFSVLCEKQSIVFFSVQSAAGSTLAVQQWKMLDRNDTLDRVNYYNIILQVGTSLFCTAWKCMVMYMI